MSETTGTQEAQKTETTSTDNGNGAAAPTASDAQISNQENAGLENLSKEELVKIVHDTRAEAKNRRLNQRDLEDKLKEKEKEAELQKQTELEQKQEFEKLYNEHKEKTKDYDDLKTFKENYIKQSEEKIEKLLPGLSAEEKELYDISAKTMTIEDRMTFIEKLKNKNVTVDSTQSTGRASDKQYTKQELLADTKLMADVKKNNPTLYKQYFG